MSTLSISPAFRPGTIARPRFVETSNVRLTRRGRFVFLVSFLAVAFVMMVALGGWATATHDSGPKLQYRTIQVLPGDTLYDIAGKIAAPGHVREMVHEIQELNSLPSVALQAGQTIAVPLH
jgi:hypothetical protein